MKFYLDDNLTGKNLAAMLVKAGHSIVRPIDVSLSGNSDARHLQYAIEHSLVSLTSDRRDFRDLHYLILAAGGKHPGILVVRFDNDPTRDMRPKHIVSAMGKLQRSGFSTASQLIILNQWR
jgi:predicted nuclease of predicted toxin-antitoxin system